MLLKNDGVLPLDGGRLSSIAVIGPNAWRARIMGGGSAKVAPYRAVSLIDALGERLGSGTEVRYARGCDIDRSTAPLARPLLEADAKVEYFAGHTCEGDALAARTTPELHFMVFGAPAPDVPAEAWSFRATASFVPTATGAHEIRLTRCGRARS